MAIASNVSFLDPPHTYGFGHKRASPEMCSSRSTPHITTGNKKQSEERAALLAVRVHVVVGDLSISAEALMAQVDQVSSIPDSSVRLTSVAPRVEKFES